MIKGVAAKVILDDVMYDGTLFSSLGYIICDFNYSDGFNTTPIGIGLTFNQVSINGGKRHALVSTNYEQPLEFEFDICKDREKVNDYAISEQEFEDLMYWLNRGYFAEMVLYGDMGELYFNASSNVQKVYLGGTVVGAHISVTTDRAFALSKPESRFYKITAANQKISVPYISQESETYPEVEITCTSSGDLLITNGLTGSTTEILGCKKNERIKLSGETLIAQTDSTTHELWNSFNFVFPTLGFIYENGVKNANNEITVSLPCTIKMVYQPIIKNLG